MRPTGIYPECVAAGVQPHLTSAVKVSKCSSCCWGLLRTTRKHLSAGTLTKPLRKLAKKARGSVDESVRTSGFPSAELSNEDVHDSQLAAHSAPLEQTMSKIQLPLCSPASLFRPCRAPRIHLQINTRQNPLLFLRSMSLFSHLLPHEKTQESHCPNLQENLKMHAAQHRSVVKEHSVFRLFMVQRYI